MWAIAENEFSGQELIPSLTADAELDLAAQSQKDISVLRGLLSQLEPTGQDNPEAGFISRGLRVVRGRAVGSDGKHLKLTLSAGHTIWDAIAFRQGHWAENLPPYIDLLYSLDENEYNGRRTLQLKVQDLRAAE